MLLGKIIGEAVATKKNKNLKGFKLYAMHKIDHTGKKIGEDFIAVDTVGSKIGDTVIWTTSMEAAFALPDSFTPIDAAVIAIVDHIYHD